MADPMTSRADEPTAGRARLLSLAPSGERTVSGRVRSGHQAVARELLQQSPAQYLAATLHDSDDDLAAYAVRVRSGIIVANPGEYVGEDEMFEVVLWQSDPAHPAIDVTDDLPKGHYDVLLAEIVALASEPETVDQVGEAPRLLMIDGAGSLDDVEVRYLKTSPDDDADWDEPR